METVYIVIEVEFLLSDGADGAVAAVLVQPPDKNLLYKQRLGIAYSQYNPIARGHKLTELAALP